jgi:hypothetical protein
MSVFPISSEALAELRRPTGPCRYSFRTSTDTLAVFAPRSAASTRYPSLTDFWGSTP